MKIKWLGQAAFLITAANGTRIINDPYAAGMGLNYGEINEAADIVTVSHEHFDHNNVAAVKGNPTVMRGAGITTAKGIKFQGIPSFHDDSGGKERGENTIFCFDVDGARVCHLGDLGHQLDDQQATMLGKVDILLIPVGGTFTVDAEAASQICDQLAPSVVIPMHFRTESCGLPIDDVDQFLKEKNNVSQRDSSEVELKADNLPANRQIIVLRPAR